MEQFLNPETLIQTFGYAGFFLAIFAESGLFFGAVLPGDSLLITAGLFAAGGFFSFPVLIVGGILCAIIGDSVGYYTGKYLGPKLFAKKESFFFKQRYVDEAREYFDKQGAKSIIFGRFIPIVRTFVPMIAGMVGMPYKKFIAANVFGGVLWVTSLLLVSYYLGTIIPDLDNYIIPIAGGIILVSFIPIILKVVKSKLRKP